MSVEKPNEGFLICPCGRRLGEADAEIRPHRPGLTAGMPNLHNRKARKAAWCDVAARFEQKVNDVREGRTA